MARIIFKKVKKNFKDVKVISELDLTINDGEFFTFVGPSGCGKSTVLNMIAGLEPVTDGKIYFDNTLVNSLSPKERDVAMVFQSYALYPHMSIYENIAFPLKMKKMQRAIIDGEVERVASLLGLEEMLNRKPKELSGGQRQRVALGRAIIRRPLVFLMDEPLSNLDARLRIEMRVELKRLHQELKITTVYVTHDQAEAMSLSDRIVVLHQGEIQQCGTPLEVYSMPSNTFVAGFIGSPPMNIIPATIHNYEPLEIDCNGMVFSPKNLPSHPFKYPNTPISQGGDRGDSGKLLVGIRPEDIIISNERRKGDIEVKVSLIESAGSSNWVDVIWNKVTVRGTSKVDINLKAGARAFMKFPLDKIILFDAVSGERL